MICNEARRLWQAVTIFVLQGLQVTATLSSQTAVKAHGAPIPAILPTVLMHPGHTHHALHVLGLIRDRDLDDSDISLSGVLQTLVTHELAQCSVVVAADPAYFFSPTMHTLAHLPNFKQVVSVTGGWEAVGRRVLWNAAGCRAYIFLLHQPEVFLSLADAAPSLWDYGGRYVFVGLTREDLVAVTLTYKGKKTEHLVGLVPSENVGEWHVYLNQLYWGRGVRLHAAWKKGRFTSPDSPFIDKISDIRGSVLKVVTFEWLPSTLYHRTETGDVDFLYGRDVEVVKALAPVFNFTVKFIEPPNGEMWGYPLPNGTWDGVVGMLGRGDAQLAIANMFVSTLQGRDQYQGYTTFFDTDNTCFIIRTEPPLPRWQSPGLPYTFQTWMAILGSLFVISFILKLVASAATESPDDCTKTTELTSFSPALYFTVSLHLQESYPALPRHNATRILVAFMLLYTVILTMGYSCNLTAFLTVSRQPPGIETIQDLYESQLHLYDTSYFIKNSLAESPNIFLKGLIRRHRLLKTVEQIMKEVAKGTGVYIQNRSARDFQTNTQLRSAEARTTRILKECFATYSIAVGIPAYSPLKYRFDVAISRIFESGLVRYWKQASYLTFKKNKKNDGEIQEFTRGGSDGLVTMALVPLSLDHLQTAFYILVSSLIFSSVIFLIENLHQFMQ